MKKRLLKRSFGKTDVDGLAAHIYAAYHGSTFSYVDEFWPYHKPHKKYNDHVEEAFRGAAYIAALTIYERMAKDGSVYDWSDWEPEPE